MEQLGPGVGAHQVGRLEGIASLEGYPREWVRSSALAPNWMHCLNLGVGLHSHARGRGSWKALKRLHADLARLRAYLKIRGVRANLLGLVCHNILPRTMLSA